MVIFISVILIILNCEAIHIHNTSEWEKRQFVNSIPLPSQYLLPVASPGELSFLVIIVDHRVELCNGVIVAYNMVLTSYICMKPEVYISKDQPATNINVLIGVRDTSVAEDVPPIWRQGMDLWCNADVVLIKLSESINLGGLVSTILLPIKPFHGKSTCSIAGFIFNSPSDPIYQYREVADVYDQNTCKNNRKLPNTTKIIRSVCATSSQAIRWKCIVDDSRIVFCKKTLIGFIKQAPSKECLKTNLTFIFSDIGNYVKFLDNSFGLLGIQGIPAGREVGGVKHTVLAGTETKWKCYDHLFCVLCIFFIF